MSKRLLLALGAFLAGAGLIPMAAQRPSPGFRLELEATPMAVFPFLGRFGSIDLTIYPAGVRGDAMLLNAWSRNGSTTITIENPISRLVEPVPISRIRPAILRMSGSTGEVMPGLREFPIDPVVGKGRYKGMAVDRHRVRLGPESWIDVWTTAAVPKNPQFEALQTEFLEAISSTSVNIARKIRDMPVYVEMNTPHYQRVVLLRTRRLEMTSEGQDDDLSTGRFYMQVSFLDRLLD